jgi:hypothetical protein
MDAQTTSSLPVISGIVAGPDRPKIRTAAARAWSPTDAPMLKNLLNVSVVITIIC